MARQMPFIGREEELAKIESLIQEAGTRRILCINGVGGIGKTRLLTEIYKRYAGNKQNSLRVTNILDFDNRVLHLPENIERQIAQQLDEATFEPYLRELLDWRKMESVGVSREGLEKQSQRVREIFIENFNTLAQDHGIALLLDTTEKLADQEIWERLISFMGAAQNTIFLLAGRNAKALWTTLRDSEIGHDVLLIDLPPFTEKVGQQYLEQKESLQHISLDSDLKQKLLLLSGGRPILLDLAVEWLTRELPRDWMTQKSYEELLSLAEEQLTDYKKDFEEQLVQHITRLRQRIDRLTLVMSWIYPLSPTMIAKLLNFSPERAKMLFDEAQTYVFIKSLPDSRITLHDEMRRMVEQYVWADVYPVERQRRDSRIGAELFEEEDKRLKARLAERETGDLGHLFERAALVRERDIVNQQWIEHALYSDVESGFDVWKRIVDERRRENEFSFAKSLMELAEIYYQLFSPNQKFWFDLLNARLTNDVGQVNEAEKMLHELLAQNQGKRSRESGIHNALGLVKEKLGKLWEARNHQLKCLEIVQETNSSTVPAVANRLGYIYRLLGELQEAEKYYKLALKSALAVEAERRNRHLIASLLNNLGHIYGLQKNDYQMEYYNDQAVKMWLKIGAHKELSRADAARAILYRTLGRLEESLELLERAISRYKEPDDHEQLSKAYFELGWAEHLKAEKVNQYISDIRELEWDEEILQKTLWSINKSQALAKQYGLEADLPRILHLKATVYWYLGNTKKDEVTINEARRLNSIAYEKSKQIGDIDVVIDCLLGDAEWDYENEQNENIPEYKQTLNEYPAKSHHLYFGRMRRIEGDINFASQKFKVAFSKYAEAMIMINKDRGYGRYSIENELLRLGNKMQNSLPLEEIEKWIEYLRQRWVKIDNQDTNILTNWCDQQILTAEMDL